MTCTNLVPGTPIDSACPDCDHAYALHTIDGSCAVCGHTEKTAQMVEDNRVVLTQMAEILELLESRQDLLGAHVENLIGRLYEMEKLAGLHGPCPTCGDRESARDACTACKGSGLDPTPEWRR
jgi:hypothetical protein